MRKIRIRQAINRIVASVADHPLAYALAVCVIAGLAPHLLYSALHSEFVFYFGAWDEDFYGMKAVENDLWHAHLKTRLLSSLFLKSLYLLFGSSVDAMYVAADVILPATCLASACYCVAPMLKDRRVQVLAALFIVLGSEVLSFSNLSLPPWCFNLPWLAGFLPDSWQYLIVDNRYTYLNLYRTPEPQFSTIPLLLALGAMVRLIQNEKTDKVGFSILAITALVAPILYGPVWFLLMLAALILPALTMIAGRRDRLPLAIVVIFLFVASATAWWGYEGEQIQSPVFDSRAPIFSMSVLLGASLLYMLYRKRKELEWQTVWPWFSLALFAFPPIILNQQVATGKMIMPRLWDISVSYYLLCIGAVCLASAYRKGLGKKQLDGRQIQRAVAMLMGSFGLLLAGHAAGSIMRFPANELSMQQRAAYFEAVEKLPPSMRDYEVILPTPHAALFAARTGAGAYVTNRMSTILEGQRAPVYRWLLQHGISPEELAARMLEAANKKDGYPWLFMFHTPLESWELYSNHRAVDYSRLKAEIPTVVEQYRIAIDQEITSVMRPTIVLSDKPLPEHNPVFSLRNDLISVRQSVFPLIPDVYTYIQSPISG